eukprot:3367577-Rhodomonas_salina.1
MVLTLGALVLTVGALVPAARHVPMQGRAGACTCHAETGTTTSKYLERRYHIDDEQGLCRVIPKAACGTERGYGATSSWKRRRSIGSSLHVSAPLHRQTDRQTDRHTDTHTHTDADRQTQTDTQTHK